jgi:formylmethanofuran dehydrogenase subunit E
MNTWPDGQRRAMTQSEHAEWNRYNDPGTRQVCSQCGEYTERCEEDSMYNEDGEPVCLRCYREMS